jgi:hypothetical protein
MSGPVYGGGVKIRTCRPILFQRGRSVTPTREKVNVWVLCKRRVKVAFLRAGCCSPSAKEARQNHLQHQKDGSCDNVKEC